MTSVLLPFTHKADSPVMAFVFLALVAAAFVYVAWRLCAHHHKNRQARKAGVNRRHDGTHLNH